MIRIRKTNLKLLETGEIYKSFRINTIEHKVNISRNIFLDKCLMSSGVSSPWTAFVGAEMSDSS